MFSTQALNFFLSHRQFSSIIKEQLRTMSLCPPGLACGYSSCVLSMAVLRFPFPTIQVVRFSFTSY